MVNKKVVFDESSCIRKITFYKMFFFVLSSNKILLFQEELEESTPDATDSSTTTKEYLIGKPVSASTFQREFELEDVLDYVKTGIASIIEDEVTQRFDSEELKV